MATIGTIALTLADWAKRVDPDGKVDSIVDILSETNEVLDDAMWVEGNLPTGHRTTVRTGLPTAAWRQPNYGIQPSKSTTKQVTDTCGMLEAYAEVDKDLADLNGNSSAFRTSEDTAFLEAMNQEMADTLFYGNTDTDPEKFLGLAPRFNDLDAENGGQIVNASGAGNDNTSIWIVSWSDQTCHLTFPKGSKAGLTHTDIGEVTLEDAAGGRYQGYRSHWPGTKGPMHKHSADQFFYCAQGQCTFHHLDGSTNIINPGEMMIVPKEHFYQLDNTGDVYMVLIGARAESAGRPRHGTKDEVVGENDYAIKHRDKIKVGAGVK